MSRVLVERGAPLSEPPGDNSLGNVLRDLDPPGEGGFGGEEYARLEKALADRGIQAKKMRHRT